MIQEAFTEKYNKGMGKERTKKYGGYALGQVCIPDVAHACTVDSINRALYTPDPIRLRRAHR